MTSTAPRVRTVAVREEFDPLASSWDRLVRQAARPSPFLLHGWLSAWWRHHGGRGRMLVEAAFAGDELVGGVPLELERSRGLTVARFMGRRHAALADVVGGADGDVTRVLVDRLMGLDADYVDLFGIAEGGALFEAARAAGLPLLRRIEAPTLDLARGWDAVYRERTSSKRRNLHRRRRRQLAELGELTVTVARDAEELAAALEEAFVLHDRRWAGRPDGSEFTTAAGREFNREAVRRLAPAGVPRIVTLRLDGVPVAFHYYLLLAGRMYAHRLAFEPDLARYSPGQVATLAAIEAAAAEGATRVEFLGGAERYKVELADGPAPLYELIGLPSTAKGAVAARLASGLVGARLALKRSDRLHGLYVDGLRPLRLARSRLAAATRPSG